MVFRNLATLMPLEDDTSDTITGFFPFSGEKWYKKLKIMCGQKNREP